MRDLDYLLNQLIPPPIREEREGFTNDHLIELLSDEEKVALVPRLIEMLNNSQDLLVAETLFKIDASVALPQVLECLKQQDSPMEKIVWTELVHHFDEGNPEMEKVAFDAFKELDFNYESEGWIFIILIKFNSERINKRIEEFVDHKYFLVAHHAKMVLNHKGYADERNEQVITKKWWEFWK